MKLIPGKNTLTAIMRDILSDPSNEHDRLFRSSGGWSSSKGPTSFENCYINIQKRNGRTTLKFGLSSFHKNDIEVWSGQQMAKILARRGYQFSGLDNEYAKSFKDRWKNTDFRCSIKVHDDSDNHPPHIGVDIQCRGG